MSVFILPQEEQVTGEFNNGAILENKPLGFPQEGGIIKPYSNIFYWANAWSNGGSLLGEHPHQGFEIVSIILEGNIEHYDSRSKKWIPLKAGDAQIIRAGKGITHAENFLPGSRIFQIWFDPGINTTIKMEPSYSDYEAESFPVREMFGMKAKLYKGTDAPMLMLSEAVEIYELSFGKGKYSYKIEEGKIISGYLLEGSILINGYVLHNDDFCIIREEDEVTIETEEDGKLFVISSPEHLSYQTYRNLLRK